MLRIDLNSGSELINSHLYHYRRILQLRFTRVPFHNKDDNVDVQQKNRYRMRSPLRYERYRYDSATAPEPLNNLDVYKRWLFLYLFVPPLKLLRKPRHRVGLTLNGVHDSPQSLVERVCTSEHVNAKKSLKSNNGGAAKQLLSTSAKYNFFKFPCRFPDNTTEVNKKIEDLLYDIGLNFIVVDNLPKVQLFIA